MTTHAKSKKTPTQRQNVRPLQANYEIKVQGHLDTPWEPGFEGMTLTSIENGESGVACTLITGPVADQPALHGLLTRIRDLNLTLVSVHRIDPNKHTSQSLNFDFPHDKKG